MVRFGVQPKMAPNRTKPNLTITITITDVDRKGRMLDYDHNIDHNLLSLSLSTYSQYSPSVSIHLLGAITNPHFQDSSNWASTDPTPR